MSEEIQKQLIVPFGKYKGKPIELLLKDEEYAKWLAAQDWVQQKFQKMYTIIIHNYHPEQAHSPEHNKMQIKYLSDDYCLKIPYILTDRSLFKYGSTHFVENVLPMLREMKSEGKNIKDLIDELKRHIERDIVTITERKYERANDAEYTVESGYGHIMGATDSMYYRYRDFFEKFWKNSFFKELRIELKPTIGDDYPAVLRQINNSKSNVLIVREYNGTSVPWEDVKSFFQSQKIKVLMEDDIENESLPAYEKRLSMDVNLLESI